MHRSLLLLLALCLVGAGVFLVGWRAAHWGVALTARPTDDLDWLRLEFRLGEAELARVRQLHDGYLPQCRDFCERIDRCRQEVRGLLAAGTNASSVIEHKLIEMGTLRARCQAAMLQHFREVSRVMPPQQGDRYLAEMVRLTLGSHEQIEDTMSADATRPHGHR